MDTRETQTEEEWKEGYSRLTAKNINFKQSEGIQAKLRRFEVVNKNAFTLELQIDGKKYSGLLIEATDSFAPVNLIPSKRRSRALAYKKSIARHFNGRRNKKSNVKSNVTSNVYSRENFPQGYVDTFNTIEARLRYGRDKNIPGFSTSSAPGSSSSQSNSNVSSSSNRNKKSLNSVTASDSNYQSSFSGRKYKRKRRYIIGNLEHNECDKAPEALSNDNSSLTYSVLVTASTPICDKSKNSKQEADTRAGLSDTFCSLETNMRCIPCKNEENQITTDLLCSDNKSDDLDSKYALGFMTLSPRNNSKAQSKNDCVVQMAASSEVSWSLTLEPEIIILSPSPEANTGNQLKEDLKINESSALNKAESLQPPVVELIILSPETNPGKLLKNDRDTFERAVLNKAESPQPQVPELIIFSPEENTEKIVVKNEDTFDESAALIKAESPELPVLDLMIFSPEVNAKETLDKNVSVESAALSKVESPEPPVLDLMIFSPEMDTTQSMPDAIQRSPIIKVPNNKCARSNLQATLANEIVLDSDCIKVPCASSGTISPKFTLKKLTRRPKKDIQCTKGDNLLMTNEKTFNYVTESNMQNTPERKVINDSTSILENATSNKDINSSSKLEFQHIYGINLSNDTSSNELSNLNAAKFPNQHAKYPDCYEENVGTSLGVDSEKTSTGKFRQRFEFIPNTQNMSDQTKRNTFEDMNGSIQSISQNTLKEGKVRSYSDKTGKRRKKKSDNNLSEPSVLEKYAIRSTNDNTDFEEVMSNPVVQSPSEREILNSSKHKETELFHRESTAQNAIPGGIFC